MMYSSNRIIASPLAKRLAQELGIDLTALEGSGPGGRIIRKDLAGVKEAVSRTTTSTHGVPSRQKTTPGIDAKDLPDKLGMPYQALPNSSMRKTIARRLTEAKQTIPHFYVSMDCEIDEILALRQRINKDGLRKISVNDFVIKTAAAALRAVPQANASWTEDSILLYESVDVSVAVATPGGLITPVIKNADKKSLLQISEEMKELGLRARQGKLKPEDYMGGTFSISNLGMYGVREFGAIINPPQACILAVGAGEQRPVVKNNSMVVRNVMTCTLSCDHRVVDGALGAEYLAAFKKLIEDPIAMLL